MHGLDAAAVEEPAGELVGWPRAGGLLARRVALVAHAGEAAVELELHDVVAHAALLGDTDRLAHDRRNVTGRLNVKR